MTSTRLVVAGLLAFFLVACGQNSTGNDGGNGGRLGNGEETKYGDVAFASEETNSPNTLIVGAMDLTFSSGQVSATLTADADSPDFPNDTGTLSGTYQYQGESRLPGSVTEFPTYTADLQLDFDNAPDYTASGKFHDVTGNIATQGQMVLSKDGSEVGEFRFGSR